VVPAHRRILAAVPLVAAVLGLALSLGACRPPADRTEAAAAGARGEITVELLTRPARVGPAAIEVVVRRDGAPVDDAAVQVTGDMTHAGMVPVVATATARGDGVYLSEGFAFDMAGDWIITADVTHPDGRRDQGTLAIQVAR
jgi:hypothetical protein